MDTTKINHISLCAGYGGIDLGLSRAIPNLRTIAFSEIEAFACANLVSKMEAGLLDPAPIWTNLKTFPWSDFRDRVDILSGGYPCQPFSAAGKRLGKDDPRHLWPWIADGIVSMRPRVCFFENVEGHISLGLREVISELESIGYKTTWGIFSAREVGAPHQRKRVFILAYRKGEALERFYNWNPSPEQTKLVGANFGASCQRSAWPSRPGQPQHEWEPPRVVGNSTEQGCERSGGQDDSGWAIFRSSKPNRSCANGSMEPGQWQAEPTLGGDSDGTTNRMDYAELFVTSDNRTDELRLLGNGVVPATATRAFLTLMDQLLNDNP